MFELCRSRRHHLLVVLLGMCIGGLSGCASSPNARELMTDTPEPFPRLESGSSIATTPPAAAAQPPFPEEASPPGRLSQIYPGSGAFIGQPQIIQSDADLVGQEATTLNFESADIREVAAIILGELLKINYVIDPSVQGSITLRTTQPLERTTLLSILEVVLEVNGAALIRSAEIVRIVPTGKALSGAGTPTVTRSPGAPGYQLQIIPLEYVAADEMNKILTPLVKQETMVRVDEKRNLIIVAGAAPDLARINEVVRLFDVDWLQGMSFGLFPIRYTDPDTIAGEIQAVFANQEDEFIGKLVNLIPVRRLNVLMVVTSQARYMSEIQKWIARLDVPGEGEGRRLYVYRVQNGRAEDMADTLRELFDLGGATPIAPPSALAPGATPRLVELRPGDEASAGAQSPAADVIQRPAPTPAPAPTPPGTATRATPAGPESVVGQVNIVADKSRNALLILASPNDYSKIESALLQLDVRPLQVLLEATIVDVNLAGELSHGVRWFFEHRIPPSELTDNRRDFRGEATIGLPLGFPGTLSYSIVNAADEVRALLNLLATEDQLRVVASPSVLVLDNETASIRVGDQQPISTSVVTEGGVVATSVQFKDTGVTLTVTPRVNAGGLVTLDISQELTDTGAIDDATGQRSFLQRSVNSRVALQSGESVVLGGLIRENDTRSESGVPFLHRIPVLGFLFGQKVNTVDRTELLVVLNATVVRDGGDMGRIIDEFRERMQGIFPDSRPEAPTAPTSPAAPEASLAPPVEAEPDARPELYSGSATPEPRGSAVLARPMADRRWPAASPAMTAVAGGPERVSIRRATIEAPQPTLAVPAILDASSSGATVRRHGSELEVPKPAALPESRTAHVATLTPDKSTATIKSWAPVAAPSTAKPALSVGVSGKVTGVSMNRHSGKDRVSAQRQSPPSSAPTRVAHKATGSARLATASEPGPLGESGWRIGVRKRKLDPQRQPPKSLRRNVVNAR